MIVRCSIGINKQCRAAAIDVNSTVSSGYSVTERDLTDYHREFIMYTLLNNEEDYSLSVC